MKLSTPTVVGIFFVLGLVILLILFEVIVGLPFFKEEYTLKTYFKSIRELRVDDLIKLEGVEVGKVSGIKIVNGKIEVKMKVKEGFPIKTDSVASIRLTGLLGTDYLHLTFGTPESPTAPPGSVLPSAESPDIGEILATVGDTAAEIKTLVKSFNENQQKILGPLADIMEENKDKISNTLTNVDLVFSKIQKGEGTLGKLLMDDSLYNEAKETMSNLSQITDKVRRGEGTFGKMITDDAFYEDAKKALSNLSAFTERLSNGQGTLGKLLTDDSLYNDTRQAATSLRNILQKIEKGEGTVGKLVTDDSLYFDAKSAVRKVEKATDTQEDLAPLQTLGAAFGVLTIF